MALQLGALRSASIEAGASPATAGTASEEVAGYDSRLASVESRLAVLTWMVGTVTGLTVLTLGSMIALWAKAGEISGQLAQIARAMH